MELKSEEGSLLGYNSTSIFPPQTLDPHLVQQNPKRPSSDQFNGGGDCKIQPKSTGSSSGGGGGARFRECRKNHAASAGGNVFDGCGEFMPAGDDGLDALRCAACNCHRNFHRKELDAAAAAAGDFAWRTMLHPLQLPPPIKNHWTPVVQPVKMAYAGGGGGGNGGTDSSSEDMNFSGYQSNAVAGGGVPPPPPFVMSKKRFRTRFTAEQKGKMMEYAEKVGWRIPREDDVDVQRFCCEIGVKRQVFKVWMHNNKNTTKKSGQNQEDES